MKKILILTLSVFLVALSSYAQKKVFFDKHGQSTSKNNAYYYRVNTEKDAYKSYYLSNGNVYFEGRIKKADTRNEANNVYAGRCIWYYKNGTKKKEITFDEDGVKNGVEYEYYTNGKLSKEVNYFNGRPKNNSYIEYTLDGQVNRVMSDNFVNNYNDWDLFSDAKSKASLKNNALVITSSSKTGTSRYIDYYIESNVFSIEAEIDISKAKKSRVGILWGFKDWENYNYFMISSDGNVYLGSVIEGIKSILADGMYTADIVDGKNKLKILNAGDKVYFSINGNIQYKTAEPMRMYGTKIGFGLSKKGTITVYNLRIKEIGFTGKKVSNDDMSVRSTGTGILLSADGYIITNYHVVEDNNSILVEITHDGKRKTYTAKVFQKDMDNDLAVIKIQDADFKVSPPKYTINYNAPLQVGAEVFTIGYPFVFGMGKEAKFTDGKISAKTGYNGSLNSFQTSIPVQPGNSGGPVFNNKGELLGIINAKLVGGDNVSYAIKVNYIKTLLDLLPEPFKGGNEDFANQSMEDKIKALTEQIVLIKIK